MHWSVKLMELKKCRPNDGSNTFSSLVIINVSTACFNRSTSVSAEQGRKLIVDKHIQKCPSSRIKCKPTFAHIKCKPTFARIKCKPTFARIKCKPTFAHIKCKQEYDCKSQRKPVVFTGIVMLAD